MIRNIMLALLAITASNVLAQFGPEDPRTWVGGVSMLPTSGDTAQWKNRWTQYVDHVAEQTKVDLSGVKKAINDLAAARGTVQQFNLVKTRIAVDLSGLAFNVKNATNQLLIALYTQLLKFQ